MIYITFTPFEASPNQAIHVAHWKATIELLPPGDILNIDATMTITDYELWRNPAIVETLKHNGFLALQNKVIQESANYRFVDYEIRINNPAPVRVPQQVVQFGEPGPQVVA